jgi:hypothetical protein
MRQPVMRHARSRPPLERDSWITARLYRVALQKRDASTTPGQGKGQGKTRRASANDNQL